MSPYISPEIRLPALPLEAELVTCFGWWGQQFADRVENDPELLFVFVSHLIDLPLKFILREQRLTNSVKIPHDLNIDLCGSLAVQHA